MSIFLHHPAALWAALGLVAVVLLHLLQQRWKRRTVPSLIIWRRVKARGVELRARRPSLDLALVLGACAAACLVLASAGPALLSAREASRELVIVLDNGTASLTESPREPNRLAEAKALAREVLSELEPGSRAALVATSDSPHVVVPPGKPGAVASALESVEAVQVTGSLAGAVSLALAQGPGEVVVLTSRALPPSPARVRRVQVGAESRNLAMVRADFSETQAFASIRNYSSREAKARLSLRVVQPGARELASAGIRVPPGGRTAAVLAPSGDAVAALAGAGAVELRLRYLDDDLAVDNSAWAARVPRAARRVGIVGRAGEPLARALWAAGVETVTLAAGTTGTAGRPDFADSAAGKDIDALVYVETVPGRWPPSLPAILVAPARSAGPVEILGDELRGARAIFVGVEREDGITRGFPPVELDVKRSRRARIFTEHTKLIASGGETLAARFEDGGRTFVYLGFRPEDAGWDRRSSFPVFVARTLEAVGSRGRGSGPLGYCRVGESPARHLPLEVATARLPGGREVHRDARLLEAGLYSYEPGGALAVSLVSERESDNRLAPPGADRAAEPGPSGRSAISVTDLAGALAALACALVAAEWIVSARRS